MKCVCGYEHTNKKLDSMTMTSDEQRAELDAQFRAIGHSCRRWEGVIFGPGPEEIADTNLYCCPKCGTVRVYIYEKEAKRD